MQFIILLSVLAVTMCGMGPLVNSLDLDENNQENGILAEQELQALCSLNPFLSICDEHAMDKRKSAYMRFGRSLSESYPFEKRKSAYMRFGKRMDGSLKDLVKRKSAYMRQVEWESQYDMKKAFDRRRLFGKRLMPDYYDNDIQNVGKRKSAYMRFGRR